jgi:prepilin-type N-terminal cleavage/methylation domain-containing protein
MSKNRGFTLIETLFTAVIVASGLVAIATIFSFAVRANISNRQMAVATSLLYDKMEELRWAASVSDGSDQVTLNDAYVRTWRIGANDPKSVTVTVYAVSNALTHRQSELVEATTLVTPRF